MTYENSALCSSQSTIGFSGSRLSSGIAEYFTRQTLTICKRLKDSDGFLMKPHSFLDCRAVSKSGWTCRFSVRSNTTAPQNVQPGQGDVIGTDLLANNYSLSEHKFCLGPVLSREKYLPQQFQGNSCTYRMNSFNPSPEPASYPTIVSSKVLRLEIPLPVEAA
jgi:hypothetical protein